MTEVRLDAFEPELPEELHGFAVEIFMGPYPLHSTRSHRHAIHARLRPMRPDVVEKMRSQGRRPVILGSAPIDRATAHQLLENPQAILESEREALAKAALEPAATIAKVVAEA